MFKKISVFVVQANIYTQIVLYLIFSVSPDPSELDRKDQYGYNTYFMK